MPKHSVKRGRNKAKPIRGTERFLMKLSELKASNSQGKNLGNNYQSHNTETILSKSIKRNSPSGLSTPMSKRISEHNSSLNDLVVPLHTLPKLEKEMHNSTNFTGQADSFIPLSVEEKLLNNLVKDDVVIIDSNDSDDSSAAVQSFKRSTKRTQDKGNNTYDQQEGVREERLDVIPESQYSDVTTLNEEREEVLMECTSKHEEIHLNSPDKQQLTPIQEQLHISAETRDTLSPFATPCDPWLPELQMPLASANKKTEEECILESENNSHKSKTNSNKESKGKKNLLSLQAVNTFGTNHRFTSLLNKNNQNLQDEDPLTKDSFSDDQVVKRRRKHATKKKTNDTMLQKYDSTNEETLSHQISCSDRVSPVDMCVIRTSESDGEGTELPIERRVGDNSSKFKLRGDKCDDRKDLGGTELTRKQCNSVEQMCLEEVKRQQTLSAVKQCASEHTTKFYGENLKDNDQDFLPEKRCGTKASFKNKDISKKMKSVVKPFLKTGMQGNKSKNPFSTSLLENSPSWLSARSMEQPKLSSKEQLDNNEQVVPVGTIHIGGMKVVSVGPAKISNSCITTSVIGNSSNRTSLVLRWEEIDSFQVHFDTKPEIIVIKPHVILAGRLNFKFSVGKSLNPEDKSMARRYIIFEIDSQRIRLAQSVQESIIETAVSNVKSCSEENVKMSSQAADDILEVVNRSVGPVEQGILQSKDYKLRTATIKKKSAGLKPTSQDYQDIFGSDESDGLPDIDPDSLSRPPLRTKGHPTENVLACEGQRVRRSVRTQKSSVLKAKLPDIDFTYHYGTQSLQVKTEDLECLEEGEFLNDTVINFYLLYLWKQLPEQVQSKIHIFSSFFFTRLSSGKFDTSAKVLPKTPEKEHSRVKNWTKSVDIFSKEVVIIPVCYQSHWFVFVVFNPGMYNKEIHAKEVQQKKTETTKARSLKLKRGKKEAQVVLPNEDSDEEIFIFSQREPPSKEDIDKNGKTLEDSLESQTTTANVLLNQQDAVPGASLCIDDSDLAEPDCSHSKRDEPESLQVEEPTDKSEKPCIIVLDSLGVRRHHFGKRITSYLNQEWKTKKCRSEDGHFDGLSTVHPQIPLQPNSSDCGVYLLHFMEVLFKKLSNEVPLIKDNTLCTCEPKGVRGQLYSVIERINKANSKPDHE